MVGATVLVIQASRAPGTFPRTPCPAFGVLPYGLYPLQALALSLLPHQVFQINPFVGFAVALCVATSMAWVSFTLFERPFERFLRSRALGRMVAGRAAAQRRALSV